MKATLTAALLLALVGVVAAETPAPKTSPAMPDSPKLEKATFGAGCFWGVEYQYAKIPGVVSAFSGYAGGKVLNPTYRQVSAEGTGHQESVLVRFDNSRLAYATLLRAYWRNIDPFDGRGQFCDKGDSYRPVIFTADAVQAQQARSAIEAAARELGKPIAALRVTVKPLERFWPAEGYHQRYAQRNPLLYNYYRFRCGRDQRLDQVWGSRARGSLPWVVPSQPRP